MRNTVWMHLRRWLALTLLAVSVTACTGVGDMPQAELETRYASAPSRFIEIDGTRLHYRDEGQGPTIVLLHGIMASLHTWDDWTADLKRDHRVIRLDWPAFGLTGPMASGQYSEEAYLQLFDHFLTAMKVDKMVLVGNSLGGYFAWRYTALNPQKVERLALLDAGAYPQELPGIVKLMRFPGVRQASTWITPSFIVRHNVDQVYGDASRIKPGVYERYHELMLRPGNRAASVQLFDTMESLRLKEPEALKALKMPVLVMWGEKDTWVPYNPRWKQDLPKARFVFYPGVGHVPMEEIPQQSVADFRSWLQAAS